MSAAPAKRAASGPWPAIIAAVMSPLLGAGGGGLVVWKGPHSGVDETALAAQVESLKAEVQQLKTTCGVCLVAEDHITKLAERVEDAHKISLACCAPKKRP